MLQLFLIFIISVFAEEKEEEIKTHFHLIGKQQKCFLIDEPTGTLVHAHYKISLHSSGRNAQPGSDIELYYRLNFPEESGQGTEESKIENDGVVMFTTKYRGEYSICFFVKNAPRNDYVYKFALNLEVGIEAIEYENLAKTQQLDSIELEITKHIDLVKALQEEVKFQSEFHDDFEKVTQSTIFRVKLFAFVQTVMFIALAYWQYKNLKQFFRHIKVV